MRTNPPKAGALACETRQPTTQDVVPARSSRPISTLFYHRDLAWFELAFLAICLLDRSSTVNSLAEQLGDDHVFKLVALVKRDHRDLVSAVEEIGVRSRAEVFAPGRAGWRGSGRAGACSLLPSAGFPPARGKGARAANVEVEKVQRQLAGEAAGRFGMDGKHRRAFARLEVAKQVVVIHAAQGSIPPGAIDLTPVLQHDQL